MRTKPLLVSLLALAAVACTVAPPPGSPASPPTVPPTTLPPTTTTTTPPPPSAPVLDYDPADLVWFDRAAGAWHSGDPDSGEILFEGVRGDIPAPADYDGDGRPEIVFVRDGRWLRPDGTVLADRPAPAGPSGWYTLQTVPADYDGDGRAEPAWYRSTDATWWIDGQAPVPFGQVSSQPWTDGTSYRTQQVDHDYPVPADYDGDGRVDLATYSPRTAEWRVRSSRDGTDSTVVLRTVTVDQVQYPAPADYDGVGHAQRALVDDRGWLIEGHATVEALGSGLGDPVLPAVADHDRDGRADRSYVTWAATPGRLQVPDGTWWLPELGTSMALPPGSADAVPIATVDLVLNVARFTMIARHADDDPSYWTRVD